MGHGCNPLTCVKYTVAICFLLFASLKFAVKPASLRNECELDALVWVAIEADASAVRAARRRLRVKLS